MTDLEKIARDHQPDDMWDETGEGGCFRYGFELGAKWAFEEAAKVAEALGSEADDNYAGYIAEAIRALAERGDGK